MSKLFCSRKGSLKLGKRMSWKIMKNETVELNFAPLRWFKICNICVIYRISNYWRFSKDNTEKFLINRSKINLRFKDNEKIIAKKKLVYPFGSKIALCSIELLNGFRIRRNKSRYKVIQILKAKIWTRQTFACLKMLFIFFSYKIFFKIQFFY